MIHRYVFHLDFITLCLIVDYVYVNDNSTSKYRKGIMITLYSYIW